MWLITRGLWISTILPLQHYTLAVVVVTTIHQPNEERVVHHKHLGVILSSNMKWKSHIDMIIEKASARLNGIRRISHIITRKARVTLYQSLVLSVLEYGSIIKAET